MLALTSFVAAAVGKTFVVGPNLGLTIFTVLVTVSLPCGVVCALKGRWGWVALGLLTTGLLLLVGAVQPAVAGSPWERWRVARASHHHA